VLAGLVQPRVGDAERRRHEYAVTRGLEHVHRFRIGEGRVIDHLDAVAHALFHGFGAARVRGEAAPVLPRDFGDRGDLVVAHQGAARRDVRRRGVARGHDLDHVDAVAAGLARRLAELDRPVARPRVHRLAGIELRLAQVADAAGDGELHARRQQPRPRDVAGVDLVAHDDVQPRLGRRGAEAGGEALVEIELGVAHRHHQVLFECQMAERARVRLVDEAQMRVRLDQPRHQRGAGAVDRRGVRCRDGARHADRGDAIALDQHVAGERCRTAAVEHRGVAEQHCHGVAPWFAPMMRQSRARMKHRRRGICRARPA
jgi:hypothetical protein